MARVRFPLMSFNARGGFARALTFNTSGARTSAKRWHAPGGAASAPQIAQRERYALACEQWGMLSTEQKKQFSADAGASGLSGFSYFLRLQLRGSAPAWPPANAAQFDFSGNLQFLEIVNAYSVAWFTFDLPQWYGFNMYASPQSETETNARLALFDAAGVLLLDGWSGESTLSHNMVYSADSGGTFYLKLFSENGIPGSIAVYGSQWGGGA